METNTPHIIIRSPSVWSPFWNLMKGHPVLVGILWAGFFIVMLGLSLALGLVPKINSDVGTEMIEGAPVVEVVGEVKSSSVAQSEEAVRIIIERISVDAPIISPESRDIEDLDAALLNGVVHYPGSANLEDTGNMFLFGHSTGFRVVQNEAFKAFNGLKNVEENDLIRVQSKTKEYVYRVTKLSLVNADEAFVDLSSSGKKLTLSTCNTFGEKQERYVVEAEFVGSYELESQG